MLPGTSKDCDAGAKFRINIFTVTTPTHEHAGEDEILADNHSICQQRISYQISVCTKIPDHRNDIWTYSTSFCLRVVASEIRCAYIIWYLG